MYPPFRRLSADDRPSSEEDRARRQRLHGWLLSSLVAALRLTLFLPFINRAAPADAATAAAKPPRAGRHRRRHAFRRSFALKAMAAGIFLTVGTFSTTAAASPTTTSTTSTTTTSADTTTTSPALGDTSTTTTTSRSRHDARRPPQRRPTTTTSAVPPTTAHERPHPVPLTPPSSCMPAVSAPAIRRRSVLSPMGRSLPPPRWTVRPATATCTTSGGTCTIDGRRPADSGM